jgi:anti-sigma factor RsiW
LDVNGSISCDDVRQALLLAEPGELRRESRGEVADHLRTCAACRADADRILAATDALDGWLATRGRAPALDQLLGPEPAGREAPRRASWLRTRPAMAWIGLSAAAVLVALLVRPPVQRAPNGIVVEAPPNDEPLPLVQDAAGRSFAVLQTEDPDITVLWFF